MFLIYGLSIIQIYLNMACMYAWGFVIGGLTLTIRLEGIVFVWLMIGIKGVFIFGVKSGVTKSISNEFRYAYGLH
jgi:hypothetical protein